MHRLLARQLRKAGLSPDAPPADLESWRRLLDSVERLYVGTDEERYLLDHSMQVLSREMRDLHQNLAESQAEQAALRRVATAVAEGAEPERVFDLVAREVAGLLGYQAARILRFEGSEVARVMGTWGSTPALARVGPEDERVSLEGCTATAEVFRTGQAAFIDDFRTLDDPIARLLAGRGFRGSVAAPIRVSSRPWGAVVAMTTEAPPRLPSAGRSLRDFADLVALAISNAEDRRRLADRASTDSLTGLANHREFQERLAAEAGRARRHDGDLALALIDLDGFKGVNDAMGHQAGDGVLVALARRMREVVRGGEVIARIGGEEFAWLLPETDGRGAYEAAERLRCGIAASPLGPVDRQTVSIGVCDLRQAAGEPSELFRLADGALYWAKRHGRNLTVLYAPEVVVELSAAEHAQQLVQRRTFAAIQALARAVDARDPNTRAHSDRVAEMAVRIANALGWPPERVVQLREAAIVHDVGKIGIPDAVLLKSGPLTPDEYEQVKEHAALGARIVPDVLSPEQASWVRNHHERWDGRGYPDALTGPEIPGGAAIIAVADAWDAMTNARPYRASLSEPEALGECRRAAGIQFSPRVVEALEAVLAPRPAERAPAPPALSSA